MSVQPRGPPIWTHRMDCEILTRQEWGIDFITAVLFTKNLNTSIGLELISFMPSRYITNASSVVLRPNLIRDPGFESLFMIWD